MFLQKDKAMSVVRIIGWQSLHVFIHSKIISTPEFSVLYFHVIAYEELYEATL